jgi:PAS domain S-box-containing protein
MAGFKKEQSDRLRNLVNTRLASFPELNPNPIIEIDSEDTVTYVNAACKRWFPDIRETGVKHPFLRDISSIISEVRKKGGNSCTREIRIADRWYRQEINYIKAEQRLRIWGFDITEQKKLEEKLRKSEEKYVKAFRSIPIILVISRIADGKIIEVNDKWTDIFGHIREDVIGQSSVALGLFRNLEDRERAIRLLQTQGYVRDFEMYVIDRSGQVHIVLLSIEPIEIDGERCMITAIQDITERKKQDDLVKTRLSLSEFALSHTEDELLKAALDEAERLTGSAIGFFHYVNDDQLNLSLQMWSTNTLINMCTAEGKGGHYPINRAGVWVDCFHERKPVIHNDYESLPHKKGLPPGHAPVIAQPNPKVRPRLRSRYWR